MMTGPLLMLDDVTGGWGPTTIVEGVSLALSPGEVISLIGRNGVGKSTTLELIMGRARLRSGKILLEGAPIEHLPIYQRCRAGLSYVPQGREVFPSLTVRENLSAAARPGEWTLDKLLTLFPSLARRADSFGRQLSGGEQQMLSIARALIGNPKVLLMDEPTEGLAPIIVEEVVEAIKRLTGAGSLAVVLVEQIIDVALELSQRCYLMDRGQILRVASSAELRQDSAAVQAAFGLQD
jgi:branched-chain amino acid transport system ATP-binding protein